MAKNLDLSFSSRQFANPLTPFCLSLLFSRLTTCPLALGSVPCQSPGTHSQKKLDPGGPGAGGGKAVWKGQPQTLGGDTVLSSFSPHPGVS